MSVSSSRLHEVIDEGARSLRQVGRACGAGTDCGRCKRTIQVVLDTHRRPAGDLRGPGWLLRSGIAGGEANQNGGE